MIRQESGDTQGGSGLPAIVHVSADFPDPLAPDKTPVIRTLLELTAHAFAHRVISINRISPGLRQPRRASFALGEALEYVAPPLGILHHTMLRRLGDRLAEELRPAPPALLVGHKLTVEGLAAAHAARRLGLPFAITIQGNTDGKILAARPDLAAAFARVFHEAAVVVAFAPWSLALVERHLGKRAGPTMLLPCPTDLDTPLAPTVPGRGIVSAFHLRHYRNKNLRGMVQAMRGLDAADSVVPFTLLGGGSPEAAAQCAAILRPLAGSAMADPGSRDGLRRAMNTASGFVLPSFRESFGLVFIEALFAGLPIIYPQHRAVSGWFAGAPFAIGVDPRDSKALGETLRALVRDEAGRKAALHEWQQSAAAEVFTRPHIARRFAEALAAAGGIAGPVGAEQEGRHTR